MSYIYDLSDTWNAGGTVFTAIKMNVTNTASAAGSKIISLQVGGSEQFSVDKDGKGYVAGNLGIGTSSPLYELDTYKTKTGIVNIAVGNAVGAPNDGARFNLHYGGTSIGSYGYTWDGGAFLNKLDYYSNLAITQQGSEKVRIDTSGNLGIGTSSPTDKLEVAGGYIYNSASTTSGTVGLIGKAAGSNTFIVGSDNAINGGTDQGLSLYSYGATNLRFYTNSAERMRLDASGNLGLGGTPSAWGTAYKAMQIAGQGTAAFGSTVSSVIGIGSNGYYDGTNWVRNNSDAAGQYQIAGNAHRWYSAAAGSSGTTISFTQAMTLDASGVLLVNRTSTSGFGKLNVDGGADFTGGNVLLCRDTGNVGIGTSSPGAKLTVYDTSNAQVLAQGTTSYAQFQANNTSGSFHFGIDNSTGAGFGAGAYGRFLYSTGAYPMAFFTNSAERMRITSAGDLGLGISSVSPVFGRTMRIYNSANGGTLQIGGDTVNCYLYASDALGKTALGNSTNHPLAFFTNDTERARIDSSGNLLVGQTALSSVEKLSVVTTGDKQAGLFKNDSATRDTIVAWNAAAAGNNQFITFYTEASITARGSITYNRGSGVVAYNTTSDARLKENIADADSASNLIDQIKVRKYDWKDSGSHQRYGFIAQELLPIAPEAVSHDPDNDAKWMGVDYSKLVPMLVKELQSVRARLAELEGKL